MTSNIDIITPANKSEFKIYYQIRFEELRKPWDQSIGSEKDSIEDQCIHRMIKLDSHCIGVGRLQYNENHQAQIRYMAIKKEYQRKGFGEILIVDLENIAKKDGMIEIILQSREVAVNFYKKLDYKVEKKTHLLFGDIQHFLMKKYL
tara:strand:- start:34 stop:474 length:441 start_codon:yes stop_codon:yes gene_type:complete